uniref:MaoC-like domain-containing protein n=1 Tax=Anopheles epiroticus TaxID=199890 RepID=A0A182P0B7_9DIPT
MFSTRERLKRRTPEGGINRRTYLCLLVDEYYETSNIEAQQQVTANLANFAYDPINWKFLREAKAHELFLEIVQQSTRSVVDRSLLLHAIVGLANIVLDPSIAEFLERIFRLSRTFRESDVRQFVALTGDSNPIHVTNDTEGKEQLFVNGAFLNGVIAGIIGSNFPGFVVTSQNFRFPNRCQLDEEVQFSVKFNRYNRTEQPKGNPGIQLELMQHFPCTTSGNKQCANKCLDSIVKHLPNSQNVICATIDRDCFRERAYLFYQNCAPRWVNSNLSAGKEFCCQNDKPMRCNLMAELIRQSLLENDTNNSSSNSTA